jgi:hypothetical protein
MNAHKFARATDQATAGLFEIASRLKVLSGTVTDQWKDTYRDAEIGVRKLRIAGAAGILHTRRRIKSHPLAAVGFVASAAFLLGGLAGRKMRRRGWR